VVRMGTRSGNGCTRRCNYGSDGGGELECPMTQIRGGWRWECGREFGVRISRGEAKRGNTCDWWDEEIIHLEKKTI